MYTDVGQHHAHAHAHTQDQTRYVTFHTFSTESLGRGGNQLHQHLNFICKIPLGEQRLLQGWSRRRRLIHQLAQVCAYQPAEGGTQSVQQETERWMSFPWQ